MTKLKKKILAGILSGAILLTGSLAFNDAQAAQNFERGRGHGPMMGFDGGRHMNRDFQLNDEQIAKFSQEIAARYGVSQSEVAAALRENHHFGDIKAAASLAKISGRNFSEVLAMKCDWFQVAEKLGVTREQVDSYMKTEMLDGLVQSSKLDKKTVEKLLQDNYSPRDIQIAGLIANESGKNVKTVLEKRKINNDWREVAKEFNVDLGKVFKAGDRHRFSRDDK